MATVETEHKSALPPYVSYETFSGVIGNLKKTVVPSHIDKSIMPTLSGATQSHVMSCLRSLGLVSADGLAMAELRGLVNAHDTEAWASVFGGLVKRYYGKILGDIDITTATSKQLRDQFAGFGGVDGSMADRAIRFYIRALEDTKTTFSPFLKVRKPRAARKASGTGSKPTTNSNSTDGDKGTSHTLTPPPKAEETPPDGMISFPIYIKGKKTGKIVVPEDITRDECKMITLAVQCVDQYASQK